MFTSVALLDFHSVGGLVVSLTHTDLTLHTLLSISAFSYARFLYAFTKRHFHEHRIEGSPVAWIPAMHGPYCSEGKEWLAHPSDYLSQVWLQQAHLVPPCTQLPAVYAYNAGLLSACILRVEKLRLPSVSDTKPLT